MSIACRWASHEEARKNSWFSRRHQTSTEHHATRQKWRLKQEERIKAQRKRDAENIALGERLKAEAAKRAAPPKLKEERKRRGWKAAV